MSSDFGVNTRPTSNGMLQALQNERCCTSEKMKPSRLASKGRDAAVGFWLKLIGSALMAEKPPIA